MRYSTSNIIGGALLAVAIIMFFGGAIGGTIHSCRREEACEAACHPFRAKVAGGECLCVTEDGWRWIDPNQK
jgi:hypothetical protein